MEYKSLNVGPKHDNNYPQNMIICLIHQYQINPGRENENIVSRPHSKSIQMQELRPLHIQSKENVLV